MKFAVIYKAGRIIKNEMFATAAEAYRFRDELLIEGVTDVTVREVRR